MPVLQQRLIPRLKTPTVITQSTEMKLILPTRTGQEQERPISAEQMLPEVPLQGRLRVPHDKEPHTLGD